MLEITVQAISDGLTYPVEIIQHFRQGEWTASKLGIPFHNQALDEFHETQINLGLKQLVSRPSHFRVVELGDFIAYLESVVSSFCSLIDGRQVKPISHD